MDFIWAIYGGQNIFNGEFEPQSELNVYLQETGVVSGDTIQGNVTSPSIPVLVQILVMALWN